MRPDPLRYIRQMGEVDDAAAEDAASMSEDSGPAARDDAVGDHRGVGARHTTSPAGIVAFVFTDLEDSTRRWEEDPEAMKADVAWHLALVDDVVTRHGGRRALEQATAPVHGRPDVPAMAVHVDLAGMDGHPHPQRVRPLPGGLVHGGLEVHRRGQRVGRPHERGDRAVP